VGQGADMDVVKKQKPIPCRGHHTSCHSL